jgi:endonuclease/exonuclease/phosphatase family metal-dependent hydrolase
MRVGELPTGGDAERSLPRSSQRTDGEAGGFGMALHRCRFRPDVRQTLTNPGGTEPRGITCLGMQTILQPQNQIVCYTHISQDVVNQQDQTTQVALLAKYYAHAGWHTLLNGDMNQEPHQAPGYWLNMLYRSAYGPGAHGDFNEVGANVGGWWTCCTRTGESTFDSPAKKIDYIFASPAGFAPVSVSVGASPVSDHKVLTAYITY